MNPPFANRAERLAAFKRATLYPVVSPEFCAGRTVNEVITAIMQGGAKILQLRCKHPRSDRELFRAACEAREITAEYNSLLIIDDRIDIALACGADGIHLGQDDMPIAEARLIAPELLLGVSTHNAAEIAVANNCGADYLNVGPIFPTRTKEVGYKEVGVPLLKELIPLVKLPFSVMGGIKEHHLAELSALGVRRPAMVTEITAAPDVAEKVANLLALIG